MEIKKENVVNAYMAGDKSAKEMLRAMFPDIEFEADNGAENRPIMERVKTFEDACCELGGEHPFVMAFDNYLENVHDAHIQDADIIAYLKLRIICTALNEGWKPEFTEDEWRWYPWFYLWTEDELAEKDEEWKQRQALIDTGDYVTNYACFASVDSVYVASDEIDHFSSRLCLKSKALSNYCGMQFIRLWADFNLCRR